MKAGKNTPQSVLSYIDAIWAQNLPPDPFDLARELGFGAKRFRVLKEKHGDRLLIHLRQEKRRRSEVPRFMAKQNGLLHPPQYVSSVEGAIDDAEVVPEEDQTVLVTRAKDRFAEHRKKDRAEEDARKDARRVAAQLRELALEAVRSGVDPTLILADFERQIRERKSEFQRAA